MICKGIGCKRKIVCIGKYCAKHYYRFKRHGDCEIRKKNGNGEGSISRQNGYKYITVNGRRIGEHDAVMEKHIGRKLRKGEIVHHKNEDRLDNRLENLALMTIGDHTSYHNTKNPVVDGYKICTKCQQAKHNSQFNKEPSTRIGLRSQCKHCDLEKNRRLYHKNKHLRPEIWGLDFSRISKRST